MVPFKLLSVAISAVILAAGVVDARPPQKQNRLKSDSVTCERLEKFTTEWFLENAKPEYQGELINNALFYSQGMSTQARKLARSKNNRLTTIWDVWPCYLYKNQTTSNNPMRCIHADKEQQLRFFENMSRAFAKKARKFATVLHSYENYCTPPVTGIWARVEFPTLKSGFVDELQKVNENKSLSEIFWRNPFTLIRKMDIRRKTDLRKRLWHFDDYETEVDNDSGGSCVTDKELEAFDSIEW